VTRAKAEKDGIPLSAENYEKLKALAGS